MIMKTETTTKAADGLAENSIPVKRKREKHSHISFIGPDGKRHQTPTYISWAKMVNRCSDTKGWAYKYYGGKGVQVCTALRYFTSFFSFMGERPSGKSIDRIKSENNYSCGECDQCKQMQWECNVRWADVFVQLNNTSRSKLVEFKGEKLTIGQWARKLGVDYDFIWKRLNDGWTPECALTTPKNSALSNPNPESKRQMSVKTGINRKHL